MVSVRCDPRHMEMERSQKVKMTHSSMASSSRQIDKAASFVNVNASVLRTLFLSTVNSMHRCTSSGILSLSSGRHQMTASG